MLDLKITEDRYTENEKKYHVQFIQFIKGAGCWALPIGNNSNVDGMTKEQSIELTKEILKTVQTFLEKEFPHRKENDFFKRCFEDIK